MIRQLEHPAVIKIPVLLSVAETADVLGRSRRTVWRYIENGTLPAIIEQGSTRVRGDDLAAYINALPTVGGRPRARRQPPRRRPIKPAPGGYDYLRQ